MDNNYLYSSVHYGQSKKKCLKAVLPFFFDWSLEQWQQVSFQQTDDVFSRSFSSYMPFLSYHFSKKNEGPMKKRKKKRKTLLAFFVFFFINLKSKHTHTHYEIHYLPSSSSSDEKKKKTTRKTEREKKRHVMSTMRVFVFVVKLCLSSFSSLFTIRTFFFFFFCLIRSFVCWWSNVCLDR